MLVLFLIYSPNIKTPLANVRYQDLSRTWSISYTSKSKSERNKIDGGLQSAIWIYDVHGSRIQKPNPKIQKCLNLHLHAGKNILSTSFFVSAEHVFCMDTSRYHPTLVEFIVYILKILNPKYDDDNR